MNFIKKIIILSGLALQFTGAIFSTIYRIEELIEETENGNLSIILASDYHDENWEHLIPQTYLLYKAIEQIDPLVIAEDPLKNFDLSLSIFNDNDDLTAELFNHVLDIKTSRRVKNNGEYCGLGGFATLTERAKIKTINVSDFRYFHDIEFIQDKKDTILFSQLINKATLDHFYKTLNKWIDCVQRMNGNLVKKYKSLKKNLLEKKFLLHEEDNESLLIYLKKEPKKYEKNSFLYGNILLEAKTLDAIDKHMDQIKNNNVKQPIVVYIGGAHIDNIRQVLLDAGFKKTKDCGLNTREMFTSYKTLNECLPANVLKVFPDNISKNIEKSLH